MPWARVESGAAAEITETDPAGRFVAGIVWVPCAADVRVGWPLQSAVFVPPPPPPEPVRPVLLSIPEFLARWMPDEYARLAALAVTNAQIMAGITRGFERKVVDLTAAETATWMGLVVSGSAVTSERAAVILTP